jgi:hypothetical protein
MIDPKRLTAALRKKYKTRGAALRALGLDESLLPDRDGDMDDDNHSNVAALDDEGLEKILTNLRASLATEKNMPEEDIAIVCNIVKAGLHEHGALDDNDALADLPKNAVESGLGGRLGMDGLAAIRPDLAASVPLPSRTQRVPVADEDFLKRHPEVAHLF